VVVAVDDYAGRTLLVDNLTPGELATATDGTLERAVQKVRIDLR
jgi:hypothetical protein